jgi:hypothetical protein
VSAGVSGGAASTVWVDEPGPGELGVVGGELGGVEATSAGRVRRGAGLCVAAADVG